MMGEERFNSLILLYLHKDIEMNIDKIIDIYAYIVYGGLAILPCNLLLRYLFLRPPSKKFWIRPCYPMGFVYKLCRVVVQL